MARIDEQYINLSEDILNNGDLRPTTRMFWQDGTSAYYKSVFGRTLQVNSEDGFPILTNKFVPFKSLSQEILWIWQKRSNVVQELRDMGSKVWDEWELPNGTIGSAYGYQLGNQYYMIDPKYISDKSITALGLSFENQEELLSMSKGKPYPLDQVQYVIQQLIDNPYSRQILTTLWTIKDLPDMSLPPCVYETQWIVIDDKVDLIVRVRSSDTFLGLPYNIAQYSLLHRMISQIVGRPFGNLTFQLGDVHLYDRHIELIDEMKNRKSYEAPELWLDPTVTKFEDFEFNKTFKILNYKNGVGNSGKLESEVSVTIDELERLNGK